MPRRRPTECECGQPCTQKNVARDWVCDRCRAIERAARENRGRYALGLISKVGDWQHVPKEKKILNFAELYTDTLSTPLESFSRLDAMLADPQKTLLTAFGNQV